MDRRRFCETSTAAVAAAGLAGCAAAGGSSTAVRTPFVKLPNLSVKIV